MIKTIYKIRHALFHYTFQHLKLAYGRTVKQHFEGHKSLKVLVNVGCMNHGLLKTQCLLEKVYKLDDLSTQKCMHHCLDSALV